jgi:hypothetical protein
MGLGAQPVIIGCKAAQIMLVVWLLYNKMQASSAFPVVLSTHSFFSNAGARGPANEKLEA